MIDTEDLIWNTIIRHVKRIQEGNPAMEIVLYSDAKKVFQRNFDFYYDLIVGKFMAKPQKNAVLHDIHLDRHKVAAVIICSILDANIIGVSKKYLKSNTGRDLAFLGNERIAVDIALNFMYDDLTKKFQNDEIPYESIFERYVLPIPYSCNRGYDEVICRDLFFSKGEFSLNPLLIANLMYMIEEYSFAYNHIKRIR